MEQALHDRPHPDIAQLLVFAAPHQLLGETVGVALVPTEQGGVAQPPAEGRGGKI